MVINIIRISIILCLTIVFSFLFIKEISKLEALKHENEKIITQGAALEKENELLKIKIEALKNDQEYIEVIARQELGMIKEGEKIIKFTK
ncbi:MAG TPA: septum formation initiator family protein [Thermodesulfobacteriota bacterium]|nr:septum formation initiator family protein [Thermodesulfobacteriota bacterium]